MQKTIALDQVSHYIVWSHIVNPILKTHRVKSKKMKKLYPHSICVIDIGSPKLGNIGWSLMNNNGTDEWSGQELDELFPLISDQLEAGGLLLGLEAPLFVPIRDDLLLATKARKGEERRPWCPGAGAQVLAMNLPLMVYILRR